MNIYLVKCNMEYVLNDDLIDLIYSKILYKQPTELLNDIKNFHIIKNNIIQINSDINVIPEYFFGYYNDFSPYSILTSYTKKLRRLYMLQRTSDKYIKKYIYSINQQYMTDSISKMTLINRYLGLLTIVERTILM
jgi:hypothetical protein